MQLTNLAISWENHILAAAYKALSACVADYHFHGAGESACMTNETSDLSPKLKLFGRRSRLFAMFTSLRLEILSGR